MDFIKKNMTTIGGAVILVLGVYVYFTYFSAGTSAPLTASDNAVSGNLLATLGSLHTIKLDNSIFTNPVFVSLSDFGTTIPPQSSGRGNPFAPVGQGGAVGTSTKR